MQSNSTVGCRDVEGERITWYCLGCLFQGLGRLIGIHTSPSEIMANKLPHENLMFVHAL